MQSSTRRRFLRSGWLWRSLVFVLTSAPLVASAMVLMAMVGVPWIVTVGRLRAGTGGADLFVVLAVFTSVLAAVFGPLAAMAVGGFERWRVRLVDARPLVSGHRRPPAQGVWPWLRTRYTEAATWREFAYLCLLGVVAPVAYAALAAVVLLVVVLLCGPFIAGLGEGPVVLGVVEVSTPKEALPYAIVGLGLVPALALLFAALAGGHAAVARALLDGRSGGEQAEAALVEVSRSRARLVDAFETERRRIERDLHDGAQQRLVSLTLKLGLARLDLPDDSPAARSVTVAHDEAKQLMAELRELIRGIHPKVLTDLGLAVALRERADRCPIPVTVRADLPGRLSGHVEATAYFVVAEALTNVVKHSGATAASVTVHRVGDTLTVQVVDDGRGGADPAGGTGLTGLADRVAAGDGTMRLSSPAGGPTVIHVELPCTTSE
ncbi:sensor histidine kinase [Allorhizocola rhizosphaerae]|uniref:sensor histidine kinase n=1 Tax=Allorhizocola rhizosphaerae TaxID=1872709 RepID=UPI000E3D1840|nr:sensor histidine kinase [Allorhizocola rhizosphaerae]